MTLNDVIFGFYKAMCSFHVARAKVWLKRMEKVNGGCAGGLL